MSPPLELVELLAFSARVSAATGGAFDVTVQPLWDLYASHFAAAAAGPRRPVAVGARGRHGTGRLAGRSRSVPIG